MESATIHPVTAHTESSQNLYSTTCYSRNFKEPLNNETRPMDPARHPSARPLILRQHHLTGIIKEQLHQKHRPSPRGSPLMIAVCSRTFVWTLEQDGDPMLVREAMSPPGHQISFSLIEQVMSFANRSQ